MGNFLKITNIHKCVKYMVKLGILIHKNFKAFKIFDYKGFKIHLDRESMTLLLKKQGC